MLDRKKMNTESNEYSKSGSDDAASKDEAAFDPNKTGPESEKESAGTNASNNPLEVSPGNQNVSQPRDQQEGGAEKGADRTQTSSRGGPAKGQKVA